jgi:hypothetical protein
MIERNGRLGERRKWVGKKRKGKKRKEKKRGTGIGGMGLDMIRSDKVDCSRSEGRKI